MTNSYSHFTLWVSVSDILKSEPSCISHKPRASFQRWQVWWGLQHGKCPHAATQQRLVWFCWACFGTLDFRLVLFPIGEGPSRGLLRDYEPSDEPFWSTIIHQHTSRIKLRNFSRRLDDLITSRVFTLHRGELLQVPGDRVAHLLEEALHQWEESTGVTWPALHQSQLTWTWSPAASSSHAASVSQVSMMAKVSPPSSWNSPEVMQPGLFWILKRFSKNIFAKTRERNPKHKNYI